jgi:hypothetical protein
MSAGLVILYQAYLTQHKAFLNPPVGLSLDLILGLTRLGFYVSNLMRHLSHLEENVNF